MVASGTFGYGDEVQDLVDISKIGCIITKSVTLEPREGNPPPRIHETSSGMLNSIGLANVGINEFCDKKLPYLNKMKTHFIINIAGSTFEEYIDTLRLLENQDNSNHIGYEINISCPNVKEGGVAFGNYPDMSARVVEACRNVTDKPLITKLSPNQTDIAANARACIEAGSDALAVINTIMGMAIDVETQRPIIGNVQGGLSGPAIRPIALLKVHQVYEVAGPKGIPILGQGGIETAADAIEFLLAGATTIGLGTALFYDPLAAKKINSGIEDYLGRHGFSSVADLTGQLNLSDMQNTPASD